MSWETQSWAAKQRPGSASAKLVLLGLASCGDANHCAYPSIAWLCDFSDLNRKTVILALQRLEDGMFPMIEDTGHRRGKTGQVKVYRLNAAKAVDAGSDPASEAVPKTEPFQKRNGSSLGGEQSRKRDTEPSREPIPPSPAKEAGEAPPLLSTDQDKRPAPAAGEALSGDLGGAAALAGIMAGDGRGKRLPDDWQAPPIGDLSPVARQLVRQWPAGAYEAVCETFRLHWATETRAAGKKRDWSAALAKWLITDHPKVMRDAKAGVSFAALAPDTAPTAPRPAVQAQDQQDRRSDALHAILKDRVGDKTYRAWLAPVALIFAAGGELVVVSSSVFVSEWLKQNFEGHLSNGAKQVIGAANFSRVKFKIEAATKGA